MELLLESLKTDDQGRAKNRRVVMAIMEKSS